MKKKVVVVSHDAGGSEIIAAYVKKHAHEKDFHVYTAGPGARVFRREHIAFKRAPLEREKLANILGNHHDAEFALLGTGWMTQIESIALSEAKNIGLKTVVYLESWSGYRERFGYPKKGWQKNLPEEIWVGDKYALALAQKNFPKVCIRHIANEYFKNIRQRYNEEKKEGSLASKILFLSNAATGEEEIFQSLCEYVLQKNISRILRIRFHPADNLSRYDQIIQKFKGAVRVEKSHEKYITRDFLQARVVIGTETVAMVGAVMAGIRTISVIIPGKKSQLPFKKIIRVKKIDGKFDLI